MRFVPLHTSVPPIARAELDNLVDTLRPLSWAERSAAFEGLWQASLKHFLANAAVLPAGHSPVSDYRLRLTIALERLWRGRVKTMDHACWAMVALHEPWQVAGRAFIARDGEALNAWCAEHPLYPVILAAIAEHLQAIIEPASSGALH